MSLRREQPVFGFAFNVKVISARIVRKRSSSHFIQLNTDAQYHVVLDVDGREERTSPVSEKELRWDQTFSLLGHNLSRLRVSLVKSEKTHHKMLSSSWISMDMKTLVDYDDGTNRELELAGPKSKSEKQCYVTISFSMTKEASLAAAVCKTVDFAVAGVGLLHQLELPGPKVTVPDGVVTIGEDTWPLLMERLSAFVKLVDKISAVHPYAKLAWDVTSIAYTLIRNQIERDARIDKLVKTVSVAYTFVSDAQPLTMVKRCEEHILSLARLTIECSYFIRDYSKFASFSTRILVNLATDVDDKIHQFEESFEEIHRILQGSLTLQLALTIKRVSAKVDRIAHDTASLILDKMNCHPGARYDPEPASTLSSPDDTVDLITNWIHSPREDVPRLWLLTGEDRSQLSAIASTICVMFDKQTRLAASFFCRKGRNPTYPDQVLATIGRNLADYDDNILAKLYDALAKRFDLRGTEIPEDQFTSFLLGPLKACEANWENNVGPAVIVVNSLDLCGDALSRKRLLLVLFGRVHELPSNIRVLVTSCPENDVIEEFRTHFASCTPLIWTTKDRLPFLEHGLSVVRSISAALSSLRKPPEHYRTENCGVNQMCHGTDITSLSLELKSVLISGEYTGKYSFLLPSSSLGTVHNLFEVIRNQAATAPPDHLESALRRVCVMWYLVDALIHNAFEKLDRENILKRIDDIMSEAHSLITSGPTSTVCDPSVLADPQLRTCHPMFFNELTCQSSTRGGVIQSILEWASNTVDTSLPRVFLLSGGPGSGKTSIAHSVTRHFVHERTLAWAFFHEICSKAECKDALFSSMSKSLWGLSSSRSRYCSDSSGYASTTLGEQLKIFFTATIQYGKLGIAGPVVFVIDGFDQSFSPSLTTELTHFLENDAPHLPSNFRLFLTGTSGVENLVPSAMHIKLTCGGSVEFRGMGSKEAANDGEERRWDYAQDLFDFMHEQHPADLHGRDPMQYADNVMRTLGGDYRVAVVFRSLASMGKLSANMLCQGRPADLEELYAKEMEYIFPHGDEEKLFFFRLVMGMCKIANKKSLIGLNFFDYLPNSDYYSANREVSTWIKQLSGICLVQVGSEKVVHIKKSFEDFLFNPARPHRYTVAEEHYLPYVSHVCISVVHRHLKSSYVPSPDSSSLEYSCQDWSRHLRRLPTQKLPYAFWANLQLFTVDWIPEWIKLLRKFNLTTTAVGSIQEFLEWLLTRIDVDDNANVTFSWYYLVMERGLDLVRETLPGVNEDFEQTIKKAESVLEPRMGDRRREMLEGYRSRRKQLL